MLKKFILTLALCCTLSAVSNAIWLPAFFLRFVSSSNCNVLCNQCAAGKWYACIEAEKYCGGC
jgi:hypothetical protein